MCRHCRVGTRRVSFGYSPYAFSTLLKKRLVSGEVCAIWNLPNRAGATVAHRMEPTMRCWETNAALATLAVETAKTVIENPLIWACDGTYHRMLIKSHNARTGTYQCELRVLVGLLIGMYYSRPTKTLSGFTIVDPLRLLVGLL